MFISVLDEVSIFDPNNCYELVVQIVMYALYKMLMIIIVFCSSWNHLTCMYKWSCDLLRHH